ncbi:hypothetical protein HYV80_06000 [Candidatus Woesearchaeota archaeon]|nr:hypothetical protein [Candidatus Woesearchaeota archaeon]
MLHSKADRERKQDKLLQQLKNKRIINKKATLHKRGVGILSAEKEIVNYWYNKKGLFTINNIKTSSNKDAGILALKFENSKIGEVFHVEVSCSITNNMSVNRKAISEHAQKSSIFDISETTNLAKSIGRITEEKFENKEIGGAIGSYTKDFPIQKNKIRKIIILGAMPKSRKNEIIKEFKLRNVEVIEFENVLYDVFEMLDTQYYKNDIIRTLQLMKFLFLSEPEKLAKLLVNGSFTSNSRKEFLFSILGNEGIVKEFRKTNVERLGAILKNSSLKPNELAKMLENNVLSRKTKKIFFNSLMEQEKARNSVKRQNKAKKANVPLGKFF